MYYAVNSHGPLQHGQILGEDSNNIMKMTTTIEWITNAPSTNSTMEPNTTEVTTPTTIANVLHGNTMFDNQSIDFQAKDTCFYCL